MSVFKDLQADLDAVLQGLIGDGVLPEGADLSRAAVEPPRDPAHGDAATNAAMVLSKQAGMKPRDLAEKIAAALSASARLASVDIAGPGFINMRVDNAVWRGEVRTILGQGTAYGNSAAGAGEKVNVEYVSANPTGPLHVGHARGTVVGDALASLLSKGRL